MSVPDVSDCALGALLSLEGRVAVVTGGARNIGLAIARRLNEAGARVVIADRDGEEGATAISYLHSIGLAAEFVATDVTESSEVSAVADHVVNRHGTLDDDWDDMIAVNLRGTFLGSREAARRMVRAGRRGVIVNISSCAAFRTGGPELAHYVASKFGVRGLTQALAAEFGAFGIRVIGVAPTYIERRPAERLHVADPAAGLEQRPPNLTFSLPLGRAGVPDDVARVVVFAASDLALLMTGSTIPVDAGQLAL